MNPRARASFFDKEKGISWPKFWATFSNIIMTNDVVPFSAIVKGDKKRKEEMEERSNRVEADKKLKDAQAQREAEYQQQMSAYEELYSRLKGDQTLEKILQENKILTGDDVRPKDAGYEFEVSPHGPHVGLLRELLVLFGLLETKETTAEEDYYWTADKANAWTILQDMHFADLSDGVVEREVLEKVIVHPAGFMVLKLRITDELERRDEAKGLMDHLKKDDARLPIVESGVKPSYEQIADNLGLTLPRIEWLHQLFASYLDPDPEAPDELPVDFYPDDPSFITKEKMKALVLEVQPDLTDMEFEARFTRIDEDASGKVEFDEFVKWVHQDEVRVLGDSNKKMTFEELAAVHEEALEVIMYLYNCFQDALPEGQEDHYPDEPAGLVEADLKDLVLILTPNASVDEIHQAFETIDVDEKGALEFDEFLEVLDFDDLPKELREKFASNEEEPAES